ncbi:MAG TPA: DUF2905 domain-containing protein [Persephonella sp.]|uniref:DUF2905 domain-containing protein n=1 Tax=Persephonella marina (strain DSM 14350 / EX-H1) TaxID=123214 RepID=C0QR81_PERMH|nr:MULTISPECIES: DUF2905 domain-containing protein [Persephonella]ACO03601.1 conserved hypothetical protein [Persephonella marina EX-H1]HCB68924.1 DUF2905 domain-containing protein [Persephonella sp.]
MEGLGKTIILIGVLLVIIGVLITFFEKLPFGLGRLPGDIYIKRDNFTFYFPLATSIVLSIVLSLIFIIISRFTK